MQYSTCNPVNAQSSDAVCADARRDDGLESSPIGFDAINSTCKSAGGGSWPLAGVDPVDVTAVHVHINVCGRSGCTKNTLHSRKMQLWDLIL